MPNGIIAWFSPLPPARTGIADYSWRSIQLLTRQYEIHCFHAQDPHTLPSVPKGVKVFHYTAFFTCLEQFRYRGIIFQLGNNIAHAFEFMMSSILPGIVVLHDINVHHVLAHMQGLDPRDKTYLKEMSMHFGSNGYRLAYLAREGLFGEMQSFLFHLLPPCLQRHHLIVHSLYWYNQLQYLLKPAVINDISLVHPFITPIEAMSTGEKQHFFDSIGIPHDAYLICAFGEVLRKKGCYELVSAVQRLYSKDSRIHLHFVGSLPAQEKLQSDLSTAHSANIKITGYVPHRQYQQYLRACDLGVNLRFPDVGEVSQTMLELFAAAKPVITTRNVNTDEFSDSIVMKVSPGKALTNALVDGITFFRDHPQMARTMGNAAQSYIRETHHKEQFVSRYTEAIASFPEEQFDSEHLKSQVTSNLYNTCLKRVLPTLFKAGWQEKDTPILAKLIYHSWRPFESPSIHG